LGAGLDPPLWSSAGIAGVFVSAIHWLVRLALGDEFDE
jgi:hypothetical protein